MAQQNDIVDVYSTKTLDVEKKKNVAIVATIGTVATVQNLKKKKRKRK